MRWDFGAGTRYIAFILTFCGLLLTSRNACGSGGTCPSGANYFNVATNSLVTLASLGVTSCYFVAANGSDANAGTSESTPWLHAPGMPNCVGTCESITPTAGTGFIFRGGDTWHEGNPSASPYTGGTFAFGFSGTSSNPIYIGVDPTWYSGSSWSRPILTGDNPLCNASTVGSNGCTSAAMPSPNTNTQYYFSSCPYTVGTANDIFSEYSQKYTILDNFEMTGMCSNASSPSDDTFVRYGSGNNVYFYNLYIHGWTHTAFTCSAPTSCGFNISAFRGGGLGWIDTLSYIVVDGSDSDAFAGGFNYQGMYSLSYSVNRYTSQSIVTNNHLLHDCLFEYQYQNGHANVYESAGEGNSTNAFYNNVFRHMSEGQIGSAGEVCIWLKPTVGYTDFWFNNVLYDPGNTEFFIVGQNNSNQGTIDFFNNVFQSTGSTGVVGCSATGNSDPYVAANNLYVTDTSAYASDCAGQGTDTTNLTMTNATATADGYTASETYAYFPPSASSPTVSAGTNEGTVSSAFCSALSTAANSDSTLSPAATACLNDTTYACTYNSSSHTVTCPARTIVARPSNGKWDIGAYEDAPSGPLQPPTDVQATAH